MWQKAKQETNDFVDRPHGMHVRSVGAAELQGPVLPKLF